MAGSVQFRPRPGSGEKAISGGFFSKRGDEPLTTSPQQTSKFFTRTQVCARPRTRRSLVSISRWKKTWPSGIEEYVRRVLNVMVGCGGPALFHKFSQSFPSSQIVQRRGKIMTIDNGDVMQETYPPHWNHEAKPKHRTFTEVQNDRTGELKAVRRGTRDGRRTTYRG